MITQSRAQPEANSAAQCEVECIHPEQVGVARASQRSVETYQSVAGIFAALADPTRLSIVDALQRQELCTCDLSAALGISDSATSQHLRVLKALRLVRFRREGKFVYYRLDDAHISDLVGSGIRHWEHSNHGASSVRGAKAS